MEDEAVDTRYEFEERNGRRLRYFAGEPGNYVGVTEYKGKHKTSLYARAGITKRKADARRQYMPLKVHSRQQWQQRYGHC